MRAADFAGKIHRAQRHGGYWIGRCPGHDDQRESLSWKDGDKGLILKCHAGCEVVAIVAALALSMRDLFHESDERPIGPSIVAEYDYRDETGALLYQAVRYQPKDFRQRRPNGQGGWLWNLEGVRRVLYRLPELHGQPEVYVVEGEKDANRLWELGIPATCNVGGAGKWRDEYAGGLASAGVERVVVLPDNDPPGLAHAQAVRKSCLAAGIEAGVILLPGLPTKGDVSDWLAAGGTKDSLLALARAERQARVYDPADDWQTIVNSWTALRYSSGISHLDRLAGGMMPGQLIVVGGRTSHGKTQFCLALAGTSVRAGVSVDILTLEEPRWVITRRLIAMDGEISLSSLTDGTLSKSDFDKAEATVRRIQGWPLIVSDLSSVRSIDEDAVLDAVRSAPGQVVIVDHIQQVATRDQSRTYGLERVIRALQAEAIARDKVIIVAAQLSRAMDDDRRPPRLSDLSDSAALEKAGRKVLLLYWPRKHHHDRAAHEYEIHVAKNSEGGIGIVSARFDAWCGRFSDGAPA